MTRGVKPRTPSPTSPHVKTPEWMRGKRSLFTVNDPLILCGSSVGDDEQRHRNYTRRMPLATEIVDAIPAGYQLCTQCRSRLEREFWPFVEEEE